jgi:hypothetical protein
MASTVHSARSAVAAQIAVARNTPPALRRNADGATEFVYDAQFKYIGDRLAYWCELLPADEDHEDHIELRCLAPGCNSTLRALDISPFNWGNFEKHFKAHWVLLAANDREKPTKPKKSGEKRGREEESGGTRVLEQNAERLAQAQLILAAGLPLRFVDCPAFVQYLEQHGLHHMSRRTLGRVIKDVENAEVVEPRNAALKDFFRKRLISVGPLSMVFFAKATAGTDGWTDGVGRQLESYALSIPSVTSFGTMEGAAKPQLRPKPIHLSLKVVELELMTIVDSDDPDQVVTGLKFPAQEHAAHLTSALRQIDFGGERPLNPGNLFAIATDTTSSQPKMVECLDRSGGIANLEAGKRGGEPPMTGAWSLLCPGHLGNLAVADLLRCDQFANVHGAVNALSVWVLASHRRRAVVMKAQAVKHPARAKVPVVFPSTRFVYSVLQMKRMLQLMPALKIVYDEKRFGNDDIAFEFKDYYLNVAAFNDEMAAIVELLRPMVKLLPTLGASTTYTTSLLQPFYMHLAAHAVKFADTVEGAKIKDVVAVWQAAIMNRLASISTIEKAISAKMLPVHSLLNDPANVTKWRNSKAYVRRLHGLDDVGNAAAYLDPAVHANYANFGFSRLDAHAFFVRLLKGCYINPTSNVEPAAAEDSSDDEDDDAALSKPGKMKLRKAYNKAVKAIKEKVKDWFMDDGEFERQKTAQLEALRKEYEEKGLKVEPVEGAAVPRLAPPAMLAVENALNDALRDEMDLLDREMRKSGVKYGDPFEDVCPERYSFWPSHAAEMPLLNMCAEMLLGGALSSMENERMHSVSGYINSKLRRSLTPESINRLTLCKIYLQKALEKQLEKQLGKKLRTLEPLELMDEVDHAVDDALEDVGGGGDGV